MIAADQPKINLAIVDDHKLFRQGITRLINPGNKSTRYKVLFEAVDGMDLKEKLQAFDPPDIILLDIDMDGMDGYETAAWLKEHYPGISILVMSMYKTNEAMLKMLRLGVKGYLSKDMEVKDMQRALDDIATKGFHYTDKIMSLMATSFSNPSAPGNPGAEPFHQLSKNELEFLKLTCTELTYQEIAERMGLSPKTIDGYREDLFHKFSVRTRVSLALYAVKKGLVKL